MLIDLWFYFSLGLIIILLGLDQFLKIWVTGHLSLVSSITIMPGVLSLTNVKNRGAAWSMLQNQQWFFILIAVAVLVILGYYLWQCRYDYRYNLALSLLIAGTAGNLLSRILNHSVVDMFQLDFIQFPVFNVADTSLTIGVLLLGVLISMNQKVRGNRS